MAEQTTEKEAEKAGEQIAEKSVSELEGESTYKTTPVVSLDCCADQRSNQGRQPVLDKATPSPDSDSVFTPAEQKDEKANDGVSEKQVCESEHKKVDTSASGPESDPIFQIDVKSASDKDLLDVCRQAIKKSAWKIVIRILTEAGPSEDEKRLKMCFWGAKWQGAWTCLVTIFSLTERDKDVTNYLVNDLSKLMYDYASGGALRCRAFLKHLSKTGYTAFAFDLALTFGDWQEASAIVSEMESKDIDYMWMLLDVASLVTLSHVTKFIGESLEVGHANFALALAAAWRQWHEISENPKLKNAMQKSNPFRHFVLHAAVASACWEAVDFILGTGALEERDIDRELSLLPKTTNPSPLIGVLSRHTLMPQAIKIAISHELWEDALRLTEKTCETETISWLARRVFEADAPNLEEFVNPTAHATTGAVYRTGGCMREGVKVHNTGDCMPEEVQVSSTEHCLHKELNLELKRAILGRPQQLPFTKNQWNCVMRLVETDCVDQNTLQWIVRRAVEEDCPCVIRLIGQGRPPVDYQLMSTILKPPSTQPPLLYRVVRVGAFTRPLNVEVLNDLSESQWRCVEELLRTEAVKKRPDTFGKTAGDDCEDYDDWSAGEDAAYIMIRDSIKVEMERRTKEAQGDKERNENERDSNVPVLRFENELSDLSSCTDLFGRDDVAESNDYGKDPWSRVQRLVQGGSQYLSLLAQRAAREEKWYSLKMFMYDGLEDNPFDLIFRLKHRPEDESLETEKVESSANSDGVLKQPASEEDIRSERVRQFCGADGLLDYECCGISTRWRSFDFRTLDAVNVILFRGMHGMDDDMLQDRHRIVLLRRAVALGHWHKVEELVSLGLYPSQRTWLYSVASEAGKWELALQVLDQGLNPIPAKVWVHPDKLIKDLSLTETMFVERGLCNDFFTSKLVRSGPLARAEALESGPGRTSSDVVKELHLDGQNGGDCSSDKAGVNASDTEKQKGDAVVNFEVSGSAKKEAQNAPRKGFFSKFPKSKNAGNKYVNNVKDKDVNNEKDADENCSGRQSALIHAHNKIAKKSKHRSFPNVLSGMKKITGFFKRDSITVSGRTANHKDLKQIQIELKIVKAARKGDWPLVMSLYRAGLSSDVKMTVYDETIRQEKWHIAVRLLRHDPEGRGPFHHYKQLFIDSLACIHFDLLEAMSGLHMPAEDRDMFAEVCLTNRWWPQLLVLTKTGLSADWRARVLDEILWKNEWTFVFELLQTGSVTEEERTTIVRQAIDKGIWPVVTSLLDPTVPRAFIASAIFKATKSGKESVAETCIRSYGMKRGNGSGALPETEMTCAKDQSGPDVDSVRDVDGSTTLQLAAWHGMWNVVKLLLDIGADPDPEPTKSCLLPVVVKAAQKQQPSIITGLLQAGAKAEGRESVLHELFLRDSKDDEILQAVVEMLRAGADPTSVLCEEIPFTPLRSALECDRVQLPIGRLSDEVIRLLIEAGASTSQASMSDNLYNMPPSNMFRPPCVLPPRPAAQVNSSFYGAQEKVSVSKEQPNVHVPQAPVYPPASKVFKSGVSEVPVRLLCSKPVTNANVQLGGLLAPQEHADWLAPSKAQARQRVSEVPINKLQFPDAPTEQLHLCALAAASLPYTNAAGTRSLEIRSENSAAGQNTDDVSQPVRCTMLANIFCSSPSFPRANLSVAQTSRSASVGALGVSSIAPTDASPEGLSIAAEVSAHTPAGGLRQGSLSAPAQAEDVPGAPPRSPSEEHEKPSIPEDSSIHDKSSVAPPRAVSRSSPRLNADYVSASFSSPSLSHSCLASNINPEPQKPHDQLQQSTTLLEQLQQNITPQQVQRESTTPPESLHQSSTPPQEQQNSTAQVAQEQSPTPPEQLQRSPTRAEAQQQTQSPPESQQRKLSSSQESQSRPSPPQTLQVEPLTQTLSPTIAQPSLSLNSLEGSCEAKGYLRKKDGDCLEQSPPVPYRHPLTQRPPSPHHPRPVSLHRPPPPPPLPVTPTHDTARNFDSSVAKLLTNNRPLYLYVHGYAGCSPMKKALDIGRLSTVKLLHMSGACSYSEIYRWHNAFANSQASLPDERLKDVFDYAKHVLREPASLKHQSRLVVSRLIGWRQRHARVGRLPVTPELHDYVMFRDVMSEGGDGVPYQWRLTLL